jgi:hypothetical protein
MSNSPASAASSARAGTTAAALSQTPMDRGSPAALAAAASVHASPMLAATRSR